MGTRNRVAFVLALYCNVVWSMTYPNTINWSEIPAPPRLIDSPMKAHTVYFAIESDIDARDERINLLRRTLPCRAVGNPPPRYTWRKNGIPFLPSMFPHKVVQKPAEGTLVFSKLEEGDAGIYQCYATNELGTAVSANVSLQQTWIKHFIEKPPENVSINVGDPFSYNCEPPQSVPRPRVYWILMGDEGTFESINSSRISSNDQGTIFFHRIERDDFKPNRHYTCTAENTELKDYKFGSKFVLEINDTHRRSISKGTIPPSEQYVNQSSPIALQGNQHKLHCFFSGQPVPQPKWYHNGVEISQDDESYRFESFGKTLVFNVTINKGGKYDCKFGLHQDIDRSFGVVVESAPYWHDGPPANLNTSEGSNAVFECITQGKPEPVVTFYKNGMHLEPGTVKRNGEKYVIEGNKLTIYNVQKSQNGQGDNAVYQCKSENKHGYVWANFYLNLLAFKPQLLYDAGEVEAVLGKTAKLECKFFASPDNPITWSGPALQGSQATTNSKEGVGTLTIRDVSQSHEGDYECTMTNQYGTASGRARLLVRNPTILVPFRSADETFLAGEVMTLPCEARADDRLEVTYEWKVDGVTVSPDDGYEIRDDHSLVVRAPGQQHSGRYTCVAKTKLDQVETSIRIKIRDVPVPVYTAFVAKCDKQSNTVVIEVTHMENKDTVSPIESFLIQYQIDGANSGGQWRTHPVVIHPTTDIIENDLRTTTGRAVVDLEPYGDYIFRVLARNSVGDSAPLAVKSACRTDPKLPDRNPVDVSAKGSGPENLVVSWHPMPREQWNGAEFQYVVKYRPSDGSVGWKEQPVADPYANRYTINLEDDPDVKPFQQYEVQVVAKNELGYSSVTPEVVIGHTGEGIPSGIVDGFRVLEKSGTSATFKWNPIDPSTANGNFTGYKITYWSEDELDEYGSEEEENVRFKRSIDGSRQSRFRRDDDGPSIGSGRRKSVVFGPKATTGTVDDLAPGTKNYAYITVLNGAHEGPKSQQIEFTTPEGAPTPVRELKAYPMNQRGNEGAVVVLKWNRPKQLNSKRLTGYQLEVCRSNAYRGHVTRSDCKVQVIDPKQKEIRLNNLEFDSNYRMIVRALSSGEDGYPNSQEVKTLPERTAENVDPETPGVEMNEIGETTANVTLVPGQFDEGSRRPVGNYMEVEYRPKGSEEWERKRVTDGLQAHISNLSPGSDYEMRGVSVALDDRGKEERSHSAVTMFTTSGRSPLMSRMFLILLILLILLLIIIICCIVCVACRHRGEDYHVTDREREQGREPILGKAHFGEYKNDDDEKRSLTGSKAESETDSMAEYGDTDPGRFTEDGSFIGQYVPNKTLIAQSEPTKGSTSTFV